MFVSHSSNNIQQARLTFFPVDKRYMNMTLDSTVVGGDVDDDLGDMYSGKDIFHNSYFISNFYKHRHSRAKYCVGAAHYRKRSYYWHCSPTQKKVRSQ